MLKAIVVTFAVILIFTVFFVGITCPLLPIGNFRSPEEKTEPIVLPMSETEPGVYYTYHPTISFRDGQFYLQESDYFFVGPYECRFGRVTASHSNDTAVSVGYTPFLGALLWDREWYFNLTQFSLFLILLFLGIMIRNLFREGWL